MLAPLIWLQERNIEIPISFRVGDVSRLRWLLRSVVGAVQFQAVEEIDAGVKESGHAGPDGLENVKIRFKVSPQNKSYFHVAGTDWKVIQMWGFISSSGIKGYSVCKMIPQERGDHSHHFLVTGWESEKTWSVCLIKGVWSKSWSDYFRLFRCQGITLSFHLRLTISNRSFLVNCRWSSTLLTPFADRVAHFSTGAILQSPGFLHRCGCKNMRSWWRIGSKVVRRQFAIQALSACDVHWRCGLRFIFSWNIYHVS